jgi:hypothetical protein
MCSSGPDATTGSERLRKRLFDSAATVTTSFATGVGVSCSLRSSTFPGVVASGSGHRVVEKSLVLLQVEYQQPSTDDKNDVGTRQVQRHQLVVDR